MRFSEQRRADVRAGQRREASENGRRNTYVGDDFGVSALEQGLQGALKGAASIGTIKIIGGKGGIVCGGITIFVHGL